MKKLLTFAAALMLLGFTSCVKDSDPDPTEAGKLLFSYVGYQNDFSLFMTNQAIWLNTLMYEAPDDTDLSAVKSADGKTNYTTSLFRDATITNAGGVITISYPEVTASTNGLKGDIIINTGGKALYEDDAVWEFVAPVADKELKIASGTGWVVVGSWNSFTIQNSGSDWHSSVSGLANYAEGYKSTTSSNWNMDFYITPYSMFTTSFENMTKKATIISSGSEGYGQLMGEKFTDYTYTVTENLTCYYGCSSLISSGKIRVAFPSLALEDPVYYPSSFVDVIWAASTGECNSTVMAQYNGYQSAF